MTTGDRRFTRIPPESSGDRLRVRRNAVVNYTKSVGQTFFIGEQLTSDINGFIGIITDVIEVTTSAGQFYILPTTEDLDIVSGEVLTSNAIAPQVATANGNSYDLYTNTVQLVGSNNPSQGQFVDNQGQALVAFGEGAQQFDAFGRSRFSVSNNIADYIFSYDELPNFFTSTLAGSASVTHESQSSAILLTNTTGASDSSVYESNLNHKYFPGQSQFIQMTVACGDTGKSNLTRCWGYFDDLNGMYFRQTASGFAVVVRSDTSGSVVNTVIAQADFNNDKCDGSRSAENLSGFELDTTNNVLYWMDMQWLGAGRIRFGVYGSRGVSDPGQRIVMHEIPVVVGGMPSMRTPYLPIRYQQVNSAGTGSSSELRGFCASISTEGPIRIPLLPNRISTSLSVTNTETYLFSTRPKATINSLPNKIVGVPDIMNYSVVDNADTTMDDRLVIRTYYDLGTALSGASWSSVGVGFEQDLVATPTLTPFVTVILLNEYYIKGTGSFNFGKSLESEYAGRSRILNRPDGAGGFDQDTIIFTVQNPVSGKTADAILSMIFNEVL